MSNMQPFLTNRRATAVGIALLALLVLGWYVASDPLRLATHTPLTVGDYMGATFCHRLTSHSFTIAGRQFPLCARCSGMYIGFMVILTVLLLAGRERWLAFPHWPHMLALVGLVAVMGVDGLNSVLASFPGGTPLYAPTNTLRLFTGLGTGLAMGTFLIPAVAQVLWRDAIWKPVIGSWGELAGLIGLAGFVGLLLLSNVSAVSYVLALASVAGVTFILAGINVIFVLVIFRRESLAERWTQVVLPLGIGLVLALGQIALGTTLRLSLVGTITGFPGLE
ncbi:MAG: DUF2085 domain-containing protein [Anaerolineales bacterium]|nr:DUF2085 domain-containing protein [Anaerolineales bacterium]